ncbi:PEP-CTERM sorting domain-containing protein [candidate division GN15 bacterium]|nr:PEP-CTERM sorting domain-containing protein [candidate division GN15 bacterium]
MVFSTRSLSMGTDDDHYQFFYAFDVSAYRGTDAEFTLANGSRTLRTSGNFDYLIYLDDSGAGPDYDHNDMVVGVSAVPEPATMLLFGLGLAGAGLMRRRHRK